MRATRRDILIGGAGALAGAGVGLLGSLLAEPSRRTVLVICVDCLRADQVGWYGCVEPTTPALDAIAGQSAVFENAFTNCNWTKPAVASLFTGLRPSEHGVTKTVDIRANIGQGTALPAAAETLAALHRSAGYTTGAFVNQPHLVAKLGFANGFDHYEEGAYNAKGIRQNLAQWFSRRSRRESVFIYLHFLDCHGPFDRTGKYADSFGPIDLGAAMQPEWRKPGGWRQFMEEVNAGSRAITKELAAQFLNLYQGKLRSTDDAIGEVLAMLERSGRLDDALIAVFGDHGENFLEHGLLGHPPSGFFSEQLRVPLIVRFPRRMRLGPCRVRDEVQTIDLTATLAASAGGRLGNGRDLTGCARGERLDPEFIITESEAGMTVTRDGLKGYAEWKGSTAWITRLVDPGANPSEDADLSSQHPAFVEDAARFLSWWRFEADKTRLALGPPAGGTLSLESIEALKSLGYLQ